MLSSLPDRGWYGPARCSRRESASAAGDGGRLGQGVQHGQKDGRLE